MSISLNNEKNLIKIEAFEIKFVPNIEKEFNKLKDNYSKISDFGVGNLDIGSFLEGLGGVSEQFLKFFTYKDSADVGTEPISNIYFPMPNSLDENIEQNYEANSLNLIYDAYKYSIDKLDLKSVNNIAEQNLLRSNAIVDKNLLMIYTGSAPRSITISWNLLPRNKDDFNLYRDNIINLYNLSSAKRDKIKFYNSEIPINYLNQNIIFKITILENDNGNIKETNLSKLLAGDLGDGFFISNITTNINLLNSPIRYDGSPSNFSLTINFIERKPLWYDNWDNYIDKKIKKG